MANKKLCNVCGGMGKILDSNEGYWTCPKCLGYGQMIQLPTDKAKRKTCPEHSVEMKWKGLGTGYWSCPVEHQY